MINFNYTDAVLDDVLTAIRDNYTPDEIREHLQDRVDFAEKINDELWADDSVTGNGSGSYTFSRAQAREYVLADVDTVREALEEFCVEADTIAKNFLDENWEYFDVTARCFALYQAIDAALDIIAEEIKDETLDDDDDETESA